MFSALAVAAGTLTGCGSKGRAADSGAGAPTVAVVKVERRDLASELNIASEFQPFQEISVYAKVSGYIRQLHVDWGTRVKQGQLLAELEIPELEQQIQHDEAAVAQAEEQLNQAQSAYSVAHVTFTRLASVQKSRPELISQQDIDVAQGKDLEGKAAVSAAQQALLEAKAAREKDKAMYSYSRITAPFDGVVTEIDAYTGALLPAGTSSNKGDQALCKLSQDRILRLVIPVPESAVPDIRLGGDVQVHVPVLKKTFRGSVARIAQQVDLATRTMHTEIDVPNPNLEIVPGMYAEASLVLKNAHAVLAVPVQAINRQEDRASVFLVDPRTRFRSGGFKSVSRLPTRSKFCQGSTRTAWWSSGIAASCEPGPKSSRNLSQSPHRAGACNVRLFDPEPVLHCRGLPNSRGGGHDERSANAGGPVPVDQTSGSRSGDLLQRHAAGRD